MPLVEDARATGGLPRIRREIISGCKLVRMLSGVEPSGPSSETATPAVTRQAVAAALERGPAARVPEIEVDLPCGICSYNLRGSPRDANCPECGFAIDLTATRQIYLGLPQEWVVGLGRGAGLVLLAHVLRVVALGAVVAYYFLVPEPWMREAWIGITTAATVIVAFTHCVLTAGWWLITRPTPVPLTLSLRSRVAQRVIRAAALMPIGLVIVWIVLPQISPFPPPVRDGLIEWTLTLTGVGVALHLAASLVWLNAISHPLCSARLQHRVRGYWVVGPLAVLLLGAVGIGLVIAWVGYLELIYELFKDARRANLSWKHRRPA